MFTLESLLSGMHIAQPILVCISVLVGLSALLYGYRLFRLFVFLVGFALGISIAGFFADTSMALVIGLFAGCICCALWYLGVFVLGAALGAVVALAIGFHDSVSVSVIAIICGFLAIAIRKLMIVISTSYFGASLLVGGIAPVVGLRDVIVQLVISLVITVVGVCSQYNMMSGKSKTPESSTTPPSSDAEVTNENISASGSITSE